ncbi:MAG: amidase, partial [Rhodobacterales bacterium]|nr:amidase [Rhodobacterales bacterium]
SDAGWTVEAAAPDLSGARDAFQTLRAAKFAQDLQPVLDTHRAALKPEVIWNIEKGLALTADEIARATATREAIVARTAAFFDTYDLLICPATIVPPFDVDQRYVEAVGDHRFETYIDWLSITFAITLTRCPALSLPCGFTADGLPVGLQMVGRPLGEAGLLSAALAAEAVFGLAGRVPIDPMTP